MKINNVGKRITKLETIIAVVLLLMPLVLMLANATEVKSINFLVQLELEGVTEAGILAIIDTLPEPNKTIARVSFKRATFFERDNALLLLVGQEYGFDSNKLDEIFINANKLPI